MTTTVAAPSSPDVDGLANQLQKLTLNYANLTSALLAQTNSSGRNKPQTEKRTNFGNNGDNRSYSNVQCYKCGKMGHISRNCNQRINNNQGNFKGKNKTQSFQRINFIENEDEEDEEKMTSEEEIEIMLNTRANSYKSESGKKQQMKKRPKQETPEEAIQWDTLMPK